MGGGDGRGGVWWDQADKLCGEAEGSDAEGFVQDVGWVSHVLLLGHWSSIEGDGGMVQSPPGGK